MEVVNQAKTYQNFGPRKEDLVSTMDCRAETAGRDTEIQHLNMPTFKK